MNGRENSQVHPISRYDLIRQHVRNAREYLGTRGRAVVPAVIDSADLGHLSQYTKPDAVSRFKPMKPLWALAPSRPVEVAVSLRGALFPVSSFPPRPPPVALVGPNLPVPQHCSAPS